MRARFVNEVFHFERSSSDPLKNLSVGKRVQIIKWLDSFDIKNYNINDDLTIDVNGHVDLAEKSLTCFPSFIKFNKVSSSFYCYRNQLTSLKGCPTTVVDSLSMLLLNLNEASLIFLTASPECSRAVAKLVPALSLLMAITTLRSLAANSLTTSSTLTGSCPTIIAFSGIGGGGGCPGFSVGKLISRYLAPTRPKL